MNETLEPAQDRVPNPPVLHTRLGMIQHLLDPTGHAVMAYGPTRSPADMSMPELIAWHVADHEDGEGVGPKDGHRHA